MAENNIRKLLRVWCESCQSLDDAMVLLQTERSVDSAIGEQLNVLGRIVGLERSGMVDDDYRRVIRAKISVNRSKGTVASVTSVASLVISNSDATYHIHTTGNASFIITVDGVVVDADLADLLFKMLRDTVSAGIRFELVTYRSASAGIFRFNSGPGFDQGHLAAGMA